MVHKGTKYLETEKLILRRFAPEDAESCLRNWAADPQVYRYISQEPQTLQEVAEWLATADEAYASPETYYWAVVERASGEVIGEIFVDDFSTRNRWCELSWKTGRAFWGKGHTTEAVRNVILYLLGEAGFHRVQAKCCTENPASERVMQKAGMRKEGVLRGYFRTKDDRRCDVVMYGILKEDLMNTETGGPTAMDGFILTRPTAEYAGQIMEYRQEFLDAGGSMDGCGPLRRYDDPYEYIKICQEIEAGTSALSDMVPATQFLFVRKSDNRLLGMLDVRHYFDEYLEKYAGNIGYSVRPSERRKGYAKRMLKSALPYCRSIGLEKILVCCIDDNIASEKTILANGGVYESTVCEPSRNRNLKRFWITL